MKDYSKLSTEDYKKYCKKVVKYGTIAFFCCLVAFLVLLRYDNNLYMFFMISLGGTAGMVLRAIHDLKSKYQTSLKAFLPVLLIATGSVGLSLLLFFVIPNPIVYIIALNVVTLSYAVYLIWKHTTKDEND